MRWKQKGYTMVEVVSVMAVVGILATVSMPGYKSIKEEAMKIQCLANRRIIERSAAAFTALTGQEKPDVETLINQGWLGERPQCICGGTYYWSQDRPYRLLCTFHSEKSVQPTDEIIDRDKL